MKNCCTYREIAKYLKKYNIENFKFEQNKLIDSCAQRLKKKKRVYYHENQTSKT